MQSFGNGEDRMLAGELESIRVAQREVTKQTWQATRQYLAVNAVVTDESGEPVVTHVDCELEPGSTYVYFPIQGQPYYLVVIVAAEPDGKLELTGVYMEANVRVYLRISSKELSPAQITTCVGLVPTETHELGDVRQPGTRVYDRHVWCVEPDSAVPRSVEAKLESLLEAVAPAITRIANLKPACIVQVTVVYETWGGDPQFGSFMVGTKVIQRLADLGAELHFDLYSFGPPMPDE